MTERILRTRWSLDVLAMEHTIKADTERAKLMAAARRGEPLAVQELWRKYRCRIEVAR